MEKRLYKAKTSFGYYKLVTIGDIIELYDDEVQRFTHMIEPADVLPSIIDSLPNKKYKKGIKK